MKYLSRGLLVGALFGRHYSVNVFASLTPGRRVQFSPEAVEIGSQIEVFSCCNKKAKGQDERQALYVDNLVLGLIFMLNHSHVCVLSMELEPGGD